MARRKIGKNLDVKGLSIDDILKMDTSTLSVQDLKQVASRMVSASNKRIRRLQNTEVDKIFKYENKSSKTYYASEFASATQYGKLEQFSIKGLVTQTKTKTGKIKYDTSDLTDAISKMRSFLQTKSSTIKGLKEVHQMTEKKMGKMLSADQEKEFWENVRKSIETHNATKQSTYTSAQLIRDMKRITTQRKTNLSFDDAMKWIDAKAKRVYEKNQKIKNELDENQDILTIRTDKTKH